MICRRCSNSLDDSWNYCPKCGAQSRMPETAITNRVIPTQSGTVKINIIRSAPIQKEPGQFQFSTEVAEPESEVVHEPSGVKMKIKLPGVKDSSSIVLKRVGDSIELSAYAGNKRYFKIINMENLDISKRDFSSETLILTLS